MDILLTRKIGGIIRGGLGKPQIILGTTLGLLLGMSVGFNMWTLILLLLLFILNTNAFLAGGAIILGKALSLVLQSVTFYIGYYMIHGAEGLFRAMSDTPVLGLMNMHNYCQAGGIIPAIVIGAVLGLLIARMVIGIRTKLSEATDASERMEKLASNGFVRFILWVFIGKQKGSMEEMLSQKQPLIRKRGYIAAVVLFVVVLIAQSVLSGPMVRKGIEAALGKANGAEVNLSGASVSLIGGSLSLKGLEMTDPANPSQNRVEAEKLGGSVSFRALLTGRFVINEFAGKNIRLDTKREKPGDVYEKLITIKEPSPFLLTDYFARAEEYRKHLDDLEKIQEWMEQQQAKAEEKAQGTEAETQDEGPTLDELLAEAREYGYQSLSARSILSKHPAWTIRKLSIEGITVPGHEATYTLEGQELSPEPALNDDAIAMTVTSDKGLDAGVKLHFEAEKKPHEMHFKTSGVMVPGLLSEKCPISFTEGTADVDIKGSFYPDALDLPVNIVLHNVRGQLNSTGGLGADVAAINQALEGVTTWPVMFRIHGPLSMPLLEADPGRAFESLLVAFKNGALETGKKVIEEGIEDNAEKLLDSLTGKKDQEESEDDKDKKKEKKKEAKGILDGLLK